MPSPAQGQWPGQAPIAAPHSSAAPPQHGTDQSAPQQRGTGQPAAPQQHGTAAPQYGAPQQRDLSALPYGAPQQYGASQSGASPQYGTVPSGTAQQYGAGQQAQQSDAGRPYGAPSQHASLPQHSAPPQHAAPAQQYGSGQYAAPQHSASAAPQPNSAPQYGAPQFGASQYGAPQYGTAAQPSSGQQYGTPQYGAAPLPGSTPVTADPVKKRATLGIILAGSAVVLGLVLYIVQTIVLRTLLTSGNYDAYILVSPAINWVGILAVAVLGVVALMLGLRAAKTGQHQIRSGIAIGAGLITTAGAAVTIIQYLINILIGTF